MNWYKFNISELTQEEYDEWYSLMSETKQHRVDKLRFEKDKKLSVAGDMLAKKAVADFCLVEPRSVVLRQKDSGKPYVENFDAEFGISHSGDMVVCAVSDKPLGIDVEKIRPVNLKVALRVCSSDELEYIFGHAPKEQDFTCTTDSAVLTRFFEIWTSKEAYVKFKGTGIRDIKTDFDKAFIKRFYFEDYIVSVYCE